MTSTPERLAALITDPTLRSSDDDLARLADLSRSLSALRLAEPDPRAAASTRAFLVASAAAAGVEPELEPERQAGPSRSRIRWWIAAVVGVVLLAGAGVSFAGDVDVDVPRTPRTFGPVAPPGTATSVAAPGGGAGSQSTPAGSGGGRSAAPARSAGGGTAPAAPAPFTPADASPPDNVLVCVKVLDLPKVCL